MLKCKLRILFIKKDTSLKLFYHQNVKNLVFVFDYFTFILILKKHQKYQSGIDFYRLIFFYKRLWNKMFLSQLFTMTESPLSLSMMTDVLFMYSMMGLQNFWIILVCSVIRILFLPLVLSKLVHFFLVAPC